MKKVPVGIPVSNCNTVQPVSVETIHEHVLNNLYEGVCWMDENLCITKWNRAAEMLTGYGEREVIGRRFSDSGLMHALDDAGRMLYEKRLRAANATNGQLREARWSLVHRDGHVVPVRIRLMPISDTCGAIKGGVLIFDEYITGKRLRERVVELERIAMSDVLTGIGNRRFGESHIGIRLDLRKRYHWPFGVLFFDVDGFKEINDRHGHAVGDRVLVMIANTVTRNLRPFDMACRWGGDEFVAAVMNVDEMRLSFIAQKLKAAIVRRCVRTREGQVRATVSVGTTLATDDDTIASIVKNADMQMYLHKSERC